MLEESHIELFKTIASRIVGQWHYHNKTGSFDFSLIQTVGENGDVLITQDNDHWSAKYKIRFLDDTAAILSIEEMPKPFEAVIKILTNDSLILQRTDGKLDILQRMPDMEFADKVIGGL